MSSLVPLVYNPLPLGSVFPTDGSWIQSELAAQGNALAGHQHDFYPYVADSSWTGGSTEYSILNEALPYWFNGLVPMAYELNDDRLLGQVHDVADYILSNQQDDGWIGPEPEGERLLWGRVMFLLGLTNMADADPAWTNRTTDALHKYVPLMNSMLQNNGEGYTTGPDSLSAGYFYSPVRHADFMLPLIWLLETDPRNNTDIIMDNLNMLYDMAVKWDAYWVEGVFITGDPYDVSTNVANQAQYTHGVNVMEGLKSGAVVRRFTHNDSLVQTQFNGIDWTWQYHGALSGTVIADEYLDGLEPWAGSELCGAVEAIFSLSYLYQALGRNSEADRAELTAYNALPSALTPDWWAREYLTQGNQPMAISYPDNENPFRADGAYSAVYGLEPNYPCCTVNHPQGLPKFIMGSYVQNGDNGLLHALLSPTTAKTNLQSGSVQVECQTSYPFGDTLSYTITSDGAFDFYVRLPSWASDYTISNGDLGQSLDSSSNLIHLSVPAGTTTFDYTPAASIYTVPRASDTVAVYRGNVLYGLQVAFDVQTGAPIDCFTNSPYANGSYPSQVADHQYTNTSAWAIAIDTSTLTFHNENNLASPLFDTNGTGNYITAMGCEINWPLWNGATAGTPYPADQRSCNTPKYEVILAPFGSAKLHMAELPTIQ